MRCFVGYLLNEDEKVGILKLLEKMEKWPMKCKFVEKENLHLNFSFLGEIGENDIKKISEKIDSVGKKFKKFEVEIDGLKMIPNDKYVRVLALSLAYNEDLEKIFKEIVKEIGGDSKPAHITLCRVKAVTNKLELKKKVMEEGRFHGKITIRKIQLIKSELKPTGPVYSVIHEAELF
ncbi:MAG: RNA 2',3'-cyclic phosphodiesterase [Candidatus Aenigmatarchaeota archaeon]